MHADCFRLVIKAYLVECDDEHGGAHNLPRMIFLCLLSSFSGWLPLSFFRSEFFPWSTCYAKCV